MTDSEKKPTTAAFVLAFTAIYLIWGSTYLGIRVAVQTMPPFAMAGARFFIAGLLLFIFLLARGAAWPTLRQWRDNAIVGTFLLLGGNGLTSWAEQFTPSGITALIIGIQPIFIVLTEWAWRGGQRPNVAVFVGMALGIAGLTYLAMPEAVVNGHSAIHPVSVIAISFACFFWALGSIYSRHAKTPAPLFVASAMQMLCGSAMLGLTGLVRGEFSHLDFSTFSGSSWIAFAYLILVGSLIGFSTFVWLMKHSTPARTSTYAYVNPIVALILGSLILSEPISPRIEIAGLFIIAAVIIVTTQKARQGKPNTKKTIQNEIVSPGLEPALRSIQNPNPLTTNEH